MPAHKYIEPARNTLNCLNVKKKEKLLIITDINKLAIAWALFDAAEEIGTNVQLIRIPIAGTHGTEPPEPLPEFMKKFDVIIAPLTMSISHTRARREACEAGVRIATMPGILEQTFIRSMNVDYNTIDMLGRKIIPYLKKAKTARITSSGGTDISFEIAGRQIFNDNGQLKKKGKFGNLPAGEVFLAPVEGTGEGIMVVDGSMAGIGLTKKPLRITFKKGYAEKFEGFKAEELKKMLKPHGKNARNLAEFGIGTNHEAKLSGSILEDEKVMGTVHLAIGNNESMGGSVSVQSHLDGIIKKPSFWLDDKQVMKDGEFLI